MKSTVLGYYLILFLPESLIINSDGTPIGKGGRFVSPQAESRQTNQVPASYSNRSKMKK
ncbi:MAG: hypothetical protein LBG15_00410 [Dysgonamonadaceae bacterium]|jgi:hypothetical protein|nr:hypothetical protein [Dysgonamonadaceae bacterium]